MKKIYIVEQYGHEAYSNTNLTKCLRFIGTSIKGTMFGCLLVTHAEALAAGYSIRQC